MSMFATTMEAEIAGVVAHQCRTTTHRDHHIPHTTTSVGEVSQGPKLLQSLGTSAGQWLKAQGSCRLVVWKLCGPGLAMQKIGFKLSSQLRRSLGQL